MYWRLAKGPTYSSFAGTGLFDGIMQLSHVRILCFRNIYPLYTPTPSFEPVLRVFAKKLSRNIQNSLISFTKTFAYLNFTSLKGFLNRILFCFESPMKGKTWQNIYPVASCLGQVYIGTVYIGRNTSLRCHPWNTHRRYALQFVNY